MLFLQALDFLTCKGDDGIEMCWQQRRWNAAFEVANVEQSALVSIQMLHLNYFNITELVMLEVVTYTVKSDGFDGVIQLQ